jgi:hypothetical protein
MRRLERDVVTGRGVSLYDVPLLYDLVIRPGPCGTYYRELARRVGGPVLDLACGTGRLIIRTVRVPPPAVPGRPDPHSDRPARVAGAARRLGVA